MKYLPQNPIPMMMCNNACTYHLTARFELKVPGDTSYSLKTALQIITFNNFFVRDFAYFQEEEIKPHQVL